MKREINIKGKKILTIIVAAVMFCFVLPAAASEELELSDVFEAQNAVDEALEQEAANGYSFEDPLVVLDPYGNSPLTAVVIFSTEEEQGGTITVKGKSEENDFVGTFEAAYDHIVPVYGLYNADTTEVELVLDDGTSTSLEIMCEGVDLSAWEEIDAEMIDASAYDYSKMTILCSSGSRTLGIDAAGDVRWYYAYGGSMGIHQLANGHLMGPSSYILRNYYHATGLIEFDLSGKIYREYTIPGGMHHDFQELSNGNLLVASSSPDLESLEDYVVEIDRESGEVVWELDIRDLFEDLSDGMSASMLTDGSEEADWFHNNSVWYDEENDWVLLSGRHKDAVVAVNKSDNSLAWILGDPDGWETVDESYFFTPVGDDFEWFYGQHQVTELDNGDILMFDNGAGKVKLYNNENRVTGDDVYSRAVVYHIDTDSMTVEQVYEYGKERGASWYSDWMSGVVSLDGTMDDLMITAGTNLYTPEDGSYDHGVESQFYPEIISTTRVDYVLNDELTFELTVSGSTFYCQSFRSFALPVYTEGATLDVTQKGVLLGGLGETSTVIPEADFTLDDAMELADGFSFKLDKTKMTLTGTFVTDTPADEISEGYLVLKNEDEERVYSLSQTISEGEENTSVVTSGWVSTDGLSGSDWEIYLVLDETAYESGLILVGDSLESDVPDQKVETEEKEEGAPEEEDAEEEAAAEPDPFLDQEAEMTSYGYYGKKVEVDTDLNAVTEISENDSAADRIETSIPKETTLVQTSYEIDEQVESELYSGNYDFDNPLVILNPYKISPLTGLVVFQTEEEMSVRVTVKGKTEEADLSGEVEAPTKDHRVPIIGLYADYDNTVLVELLDADGNVTQEQELTVTTEGLPDFFDNIIEPVTVSGSSAFDLTMVYGQSTSRPFAYDCNGDIRWCFTMQTGNYGLYLLSDGRMIVQDNDGYALSQQKPVTTNFYEMDYLGRAYNLYYLAKGGHHEFIEKEPGGNLLCLTSTLEGHYENAIMELDRETGETVCMFGLEEIFGTTYVDKVDWAHINTISYQADEDAIIISCRNLHSVIKLDWTTHDIKWILCNPEFWEDTDFAEYVLQPEGDFNWHYQQHSAYQLSTDLDGNPDTVELSLFDNHYLSTRKVDFFDGLDTSFVVVYSIDEDAMTVSQIKSLPVVLSSITSNTVYDEASGHIFGMCGHVEDSEDKRKGMTYEFDYETGEILNQFSLKKTFYRASKMEINYNDLASKMDVSEDYIKGELMSPVETDAKIKKPKKELKEGVSFYIMSGVLYEVAADHSVSQTIFKGENHSYVLDTTEIRQHSNKYEDFEVSLAIPLEDMESDVYDIYVVYEDTYYRTGESFTIN